MLVYDTHDNKSVVFTIEITDCLHLRVSVCWSLSGFIMASIGRGLFIQQSEVTTHHTLGCLIVKKNGSVWTQHQDF